MEIRLRNVSKYFPANGVQALNGADFDLTDGEIHALIGENGAGKSTLMHILAGHLEMTTGELHIDEIPCRFSRPAEALQFGIGIVRQHPVLAPGLKLWEDALLGLPDPPLFPLDRRKGLGRFQELSDRWGFDLDGNAKTENLTISQRQKASILTLLLHQARCIILDEPTAVLTPIETERLFTLLRKLKSDGKAIVLISHKLDEILSVADRITVLRLGRTVASMPRSRTSEAELTSYMFGQDKGDSLDLHNTSLAAGRHTARINSNQEPLLHVTNLSSAQKDSASLRDLSFSVFPGEVYGIAGVRDSGLETLELALTGFIAPQDGHITLNGIPVQGRGALAFRQAGAAYVSADRLGKALALRLPIIDSLIVHSHRRFVKKWPFIPELLDKRAIRNWAAELFRISGIQGRFESPAETFSGGQLQRLILAREFAEEPSLMVLAEPGWGLDASGKALLYDRLSDYLRRGGTVVLFSTDVDELLMLSSRIMVLHDGYNVLELQLPEDYDQRLSLKKQISAAMVGTGGVAA
ncbi:ABC transporter ATP-binding protein [Gracilinema caldarium]|uniref:ABC transporter ATP-binding protein n=1 Tax=Gracilinema caldarium TaxID=215591 RepID=UPI0026F341B4|nr:ATP-binding cassette domain-containing protein [Gracilinema caldarium]